MKKALFTLFCFAVQTAWTCTGIMLLPKDGSIVSGRTLEFGTPIEIFGAFIPRNYQFQGQTPKGDGLSYQSRYSAVGVYCFKDALLMDGINEKGLVAATFYFPGFAKYAEIDQSNQSKALSPIDFPNWILTQFATVEEVKKALPSVVIAPTVIEGWGSTPPPFHYIVYDRSGKSLVIEPREGKLFVHENPLGVLTNSPNFIWHMKNLRNYINLTNFNVDPITIRGVELAPFGQGSGMVGLPGDFTPPSRFVRAAIFSTTAFPTLTGEEAVSQAFHILNQFDIPLGSVKEEQNGQVGADYTMMTSVKDSKNLKYYFKSYKDQNIRYLDLNQFDGNDKSIRSAQFEQPQEYLDVSKNLKALKS